jgi:H+/Cl- antiporter ClcA
VSDGPDAGPASALRRLGTAIGLGAAVGVVCGLASALFLWLLDLATAFRGEHRTIVFLLPVAGVVIGWLYERLGPSVRGGTNRVIEAADGGPVLPLRLAPAVLLGTVATHVFGGSAGREGTAVQMGAALADGLGHRLGIRGRELRRALVVAGIAGGFGAVFGTPLAGAVFGLELVVVGRLRIGAAAPALVAAAVGDVVTRGLGIVHTPYPAVAPLAMSPRLVAIWLVFAVAVAAVVIAFIELGHLIQRAGLRYLAPLPLRLCAGGVIVVGLWQLVGSDDYLGLGVPTIVRAFVDPTLPTDAFAWKLVFTAVTVGCGFLGGEVTPLFFIGATLGNALAQALGVPIGMGAGVAMAAVFAAASNAPIALSIMAVELLGVAVLPHVAIVAVVAYLLTGRRSIYPAQRMERDKLGRRVSSEG